MSALIRLPLLLTIFAFASQGRAAETHVFPEDKVLTRLESSLPHGWKMIRAGDRLIIEGDKPLWEVSFNRINAPPTWGDDAEREWKEFKKTHDAIKARFVFRVEPRWSAGKIQGAKAKDKEFKPPSNTDRYSLFVIEKHGIEDELTVIFPREAGQDAWAGWNLVETMLEN